MDRENKKNIPFHMRWEGKAWSSGLRFAFRYGIFTEDIQSLVPSSGILGINRDLLF